jgi:hypothetical protein
MAKTRQSLPINSLSKTRSVLDEVQVPAVLAGAEIDRPNGPPPQDGARLLE